jgi:hypothetical protein
MLASKRKPTNPRDVDDAQRSAASPDPAAPPASRSLPDGPSDAQLLSELTVEDSEPGRFHMASWRNVLMVRWESAADSSAVERLAKVSKALAAANLGTRRSNIHVIGEGVGLPTPAARDGFVELMKEHADRLACVAIVVGGTGFLASAMRSLMTGMRLLAPRSFNYRLHGSIEEVAKWLPTEHLAKPGEEIDGRRLGQVLELWAKTASATPPPASSR